MHLGPVPGILRGWGSRVFDRSAFQCVKAFSRPVNRLLGVWVMLVTGRQSGFGVFPPGNWWVERFRG